MTAVINLHHNTSVTEPIGSTFHAQINLTDQYEEPYKRNVQIGPEPTRMDTGWLSAGYHTALIANVTGNRPQVQQSEEQKEEIKRQVLFVAFREVDCLQGINGLVLPPGLFNMISVSPDAVVWMKCLGELGCRVSLTLIPR
jgi:hypothetical protein